MLVEWDLRERLREKARDLVASGPDVIFSEYPSFVAEETATIPIVFANQGEGGALYLVGDFRRPRANITGVIGPYNEHTAKRLESTRELLPKARHLALIHNSDVSWLDPKERAMAQAGHSKRLTTISEAAARLGFEVIHGDVAKHGGDLDATLDSVRTKGAQIIFPVASATIRDKDRYGKFARFQEVHRIAYIGDGASANAPSKASVSNTKPAGILTRSSAPFAPLPTTLKTSVAVMSSSARIATHRANRSFRRLAYPNTSSTRSSKS
jgi:hypothetical protein